MDQKYKEFLESNGIDTQDLLAQIQSELQNPAIAIDLENMDPEELKMNLANPQFRAMLEGQGYDVEDLIQQVGGVDMGGTEGIKFLTFIQN